MGLPDAVSVTWLWWEGKNTRDPGSCPLPLPLDHHVALSPASASRLPIGSFTPSSYGHLSHSPFYFIQVASTSSFCSIYCEIHPSANIFVHTGFSLPLPIVILSLLPLLLLFFRDCFAFDTTK